MAKRLGILWDVKYFWLVSTTLALAIFSVACGGANIDNKEAVQAAMVEYLNTKGTSLGLDPNAMDVNVDAVVFERDTARATVGFMIKGTDQGMHMNYTLTRQGDKWGNVQKSNETAAPHTMEGGAELPPAGAAPPAAEDGTGKSEPLLPVPLPGTQPALPAGHPPVTN